MLRVVASEKNVSDYRDLLLAEWGKQLPQKVLGLLWSTVESQQTNQEGKLLKLLNPGVNGAFPTELFRGIADRVGYATRFMRFQDLPALPQPYDPGSRLSVAGWQANRLTAYITLQSSADLSGDVDFFRDVQSLAFQAALHFVLSPASRGKRLPEHTILLHALLVFPLQYLAVDPAHYCYLISMIHGYMGNVEQRLSFLDASFRFTRPDDHSFLTKAQEYWSELIDERRVREAEEFLFSLHWWCLPSQQEEVREMMVDALKRTLGEQAHAH